jgi:hypothetical protein
VRALPRAAKQAPRAVVPRQATPLRLGWRRNLAGSAAARGSRRRTPRNRKQTRPPPFPNAPHRCTQSAPGSASEPRGWRRGRPHRASGRCGPASGGAPVFFFLGGWLHSVQFVCSGGPGRGASARCQGCVGPSRAAGNRARRDGGGAFGGLRAMPAAAQLAGNLGPSPRARVLSVAPPRRPPREPAASPRPWGAPGPRGTRCWQAKQEAPPPRLDLGLNFVEGLGSHLRIALPRRGGRGRAGRQRHLPHHLGRDRLCHARPGRCLAVLALGGSPLPAAPRRRRCRVAGRPCQMRACRRLVRSATWDAATVQAAPMRSGHESARAHTPRRHPAGTRGGGAVETPMRTLFYASWKYFQCFIPASPRPPTPPQTAEQPNRSAHPPSRPARRAAISSPRPAEPPRIGHG